MKVFTSSAIAALCAGFVVGCSPKQEPAKPAKPTVEAATAKTASTEAAIATGSAEPGQVGLKLPPLAPAPKWQLKDVNGQPVTSDDFKGKVVVLDFWATWCPPCRAEIPGYTDLQRKYGKDGLAIVGVSVDEGGPAVVKEFVQKFGVGYQIVMADDAIQTAFGGMEGIPTTFLIDRQGRIRDKKIGAEPTAEYEKKIQAVLNSGD